MTIPPILQTPLPPGPPLRPQVHEGDEDDVEEGERHLEPVEERDAEQRRFQPVVQRRRERYQHRHEQQPVPGVAGPAGGALAGRTDNAALSRRGADVQTRPARRPRPARPLLPGEHAQDAAAAHPRAAAVAGRRRRRHHRGREHRGQPGRHRQRRLLLGGSAVPRADAAVGQRRGQRPRAGQRRGAADRSGDAADRRPARRFRHRRRHAVGVGRGRAVVVSVRPCADLPRRSFTDLRFCHRMLPSDFQ